MKQPYSQGAIDRIGDIVSSKSLLPSLTQTFKLLDVDINLKLAAKCHSEPNSPNPPPWKLKYWARRRDNHKKDLKISLKVVKESDTLEMF